MGRRLSARRAGVDEVVALLDLFDTRYRHFTAWHFWEKLVAKHDVTRSYNWVRLTLQSYVQNLLQKGFDHVAECCRGHGWRVDIRYRSAGHAQPPSGGLLHQLAFVLRQ